MNSSHCVLKPLSYAVVSGTACQPPKKSIACRRSGFHTGFGVLTRDCVTQSLSPATAEPCVPSTWKVTRSSRRTRVHQLLLIVATTPPSSWNIAYAASSAVAAYLRPCSSRRSGMCVAPRQHTLFTSPKRWSRT